MNDNSGIPEFGKPSRLRTWLFCGVLFIGGAMGFLMSYEQICAVAPIVVGLVMLSLIFTKLPFVKPIKPTLGMLAVTAIVCGTLDMMLSDQGFRGRVGHRIAAALYRCKGILWGWGLVPCCCHCFTGTGPQL
jgi:hypothetical protein